MWISTRQRGIVAGLPPRPRRNPGAQPNPVSCSRSALLRARRTMSESVDLLDQKSHFAFGKNWASYARLITDAQVDEAIASLRRLAGGDLTGKRFLDIGSG